MIQKPYPKDIKDLETELDAVVKMRDIEELYDLKDRVSIKWWETGMVLLLFGSGFGFILTASRLIPLVEPFLYWFSLFWVGAIVLTLIACIEFLIAKFRALRRLYETQTRIITRHENELAAMRKDIARLKGHAEPAGPQATKEEL